LGKKTGAYILTTIAFLALLLSFPGFSARAQAQTGPSNLIMASSSNATSTSVTESLSSTSSTTLSASNTSSISTSSDSISSTSTSTTNSSTSYTSTDNGDPTVTVTSTITASDTTGISSWTHYWNQHSTGSSNADYSISFNPSYWLCTDVYVSFTGPLVESGFYGDTLQFQYFQYSPSYPSVLTSIFTDPGLTVTSDTVNYVINYNEYAPVNFAYMPNIAVKVVDTTPKSNGYVPGQIFMELTNIFPEGYQSCQNDPPAPVPEFQAGWSVIMVSVALALVFVQARNHKYGMAATKKYPRLTTQDNGAQRQTK
jgi:hypothetical protein